MTAPLLIADFAMEFSIERDSPPLVREKPASKP
jgi:hypothetical protein